MSVLIHPITIIVALILANMTATAQTNAATKGTLIVGILKVQSSYAQNKEEPAKEVPDTVQFWLNAGSDNNWRIRTYAIDHDIHPHSLGDLGKMKDHGVDFARAHISKNYGDVLQSVTVLEFTDTSDTNAVRRVLAEHKLKGTLEVSKKNGFAFLNPDDGEYRSRTKPK